MAKPTYPYPLATSRYGFFFDSFRLEGGLRTKLKLGPVLNFWSKINPLKLALRSQEARDVSFVQSMAGLAAKISKADADAKKARELGAEGIGLCRTEHMFFEEDRIAAFREMICSDTVEEREAALDKILPYQQGDFEKLYEALEGCPVTIRFLDPPLHEFVPTEEADIEKLAKAQGKSVETIKNIIASLPYSWTMSVISFIRPATSRRWNAWKSLYSLVGTRYWLL